MENGCTADGKQQIEPTGSTLAQVQSTGTDALLQNFRIPGVTRTETQRVQTRRRQSVIERESNRETLRALREWAKSTSHRTNFWSLFDPGSWSHWSRNRPSQHQLVALTQHYFPPRPKVLVQVFDFGLDRAERNEIELGDIEKVTSHWEWVYSILLWKTFSSKSGPGVDPSIVLVDMVGRTPRLRC